jgi:hypothetical protein
MRLLLGGLFGAVFDKSLGRSFFALEVGFAALAFDKSVGWFHKTYYLYEVVKNSSRDKT